MSALASAPARKRKFPWWIYVLIFLLICLFAISPIIPVTIAENIAHANGCQVDEGSVHPCMVDGVDQGELVYNLGMMGWLFLATGPLAMIFWLVWLLVMIVHRILWGRGARA